MTAAEVEAKLCLLAEMEREANGFDYAGAARG
jgi:hypothetical protein